MKRNSHRFFHLLPLLLGLSFIAASSFVRGQQAPRQPSRAGIYEGQLLHGATNPVNDRVLPQRSVILEFHADAHEYRVRGALFDMTTEPPKAIGSLLGRFDEKANKFDRFLGLRWSDIPSDRDAIDEDERSVAAEGFQGRFEKDADGNEYLLLWSGPSRRIGFILFRQTTPPPKVSQGNLAVEFAVVEPAETALGKPVIVKYEYRATDIINTALKVQESLTITCPDAPPFEAKGTRGFLDFQHREGFRMDGAGKGERSFIAPKPGAYKCRIELSAAGYSTSAVREVSFTVKPDSSQTGAGAATGVKAGVKAGPAAILPGTPIWVLKKVDIDPVKIAEKDAKKPERERERWQVSANRASAEFQAPIGNSNDGPRMKVSLTFGGAVPAVLRPGDKFDVTVTANAGPEKNISGFAGIQGRVDANGLKVTRTPKDAVARAGALTQGFIPRQQVTFHCEVPQELSPRDQSEIIVSRIVEGRASLVDCHYVADVASATTPAAGSQVSLAGDNATAADGAAPQAVIGPAEGNAGGHNLNARLAMPMISLTPGEPSQMDGVYVSGWRSDTANRVEVDMEVVDNWGSLKVNPKIVAAPGPTSADPGNMTSGEHYFSQMWSARSGARPGIFRVPIIVRQKGVGATAVILPVRILPKGLSSREAVVRVGFNELKPGYLNGDEFRVQGLRLTASQGRLNVAPAQSPPMVMPGGQKQVLMVEGDRVTEFALEFDPPVKSFTITLPGLGGGASFPTYSIAVFNPAGVGFDRIGQEHWIPSAAAPTRITLDNGMMSRAVISVDNRFGNTAWATYNCLPIAEIELQR